ncbi:LysR family transcriptional regulator [Halalkalibacterium ligniniphilum]|uniref:LysR family transcriptional regulator n=1 Tax=Halalkalibacterium ligniniphilum TaxID=1134413 RepID=UPI00034BAA76|nr:LysR family transcriptional regulator [Halalkalibacterium ligniniphilum]
MELKYIEAFLKIVEKGSFSAAANDLNITQPTISIRIQHLEDQLNTKLFKRVSGRKIMLTSEGEKIYPYFKEACHLIEEGCNALSNRTKKVTISCPNHMGVEVLPELLKVLYAEFPTIDFEVKIATTDESLKAIRNGEIEFAFAYLESEDQYIDEINMVKISNEINTLVCAPDHSFAKRGHIAASDLIQERLIVYNRDFSTTKLIEQYLLNQGVKNYKTVEINNVGWIKMMVRKGLGVAFLQKMIVNDELKSEKLVEVPLLEPLTPTPIYLIFKKNIAKDLRQTVIKAAENLM